MSETPDSTTCLMILVRHGATEANLANPARLQGRVSDPALSPTGRQQADAVATLLESVPLSAAFCSPLVRARETAQIVMQVTTIGSSKVKGECNVKLYKLTTTI